MNKHVLKYGKLSEALYDSLIYDPYYLSLEKTISGNKEEKREALIMYFNYSIIEGELFGKTFIPNGIDYGTSVWLKPLDSKEELTRKNNKKDFIISYLGYKTWSFYDAVNEFMVSKLTGIVSPNSWYLSILGIKPEYQNKGLGRTLLIPILKETDKKGIPTYLETYNSRNMKFYERIGYKGITCFYEPLTQSDYWIMVRHPNKEKNDSKF